jgi:hypothetical protein
MELPFLERYSGESLDQLIGLKDHYRIDSLVLAVEEALYSKPLSQLSVSERAVLAVEAMEREVNNGGYHQFFCNSSGVFTRHLVEALNSIGCPKTAAISSAAISVLNLPGEYDHDTIIDMAMKLSDEERGKLNDLDKEYYSNDEPIAQRLFEYIEMNRNGIHLPVSAS